MAYSVLVAETAWPEVPETVKPSKKIREERLEILNKSHILRPSHFLKHSHILKPSHARQFIPRARRQFTYETPHLQGPVPSESPANHGKTRASQRFSNPLIFSNRLTPDSSYPVRVARSPAKLPTWKVLYAVGRLQNLRKTRASQRFSNCPIFSNRLTPHGSCSVRVAKTPYLEGPVRSASPAEPEENTSEPAILKLSHILKPSHAARLMLRARRQDSLPGRSCTQ